MSCEVKCFLIYRTHRETTTLFTVFASGLLQAIRKLTDEPVRVSRSIPSKSQWIPKFCDSRQGMEYYVPGSAVTLIAFPLRERGGR